MSNTAKTLAERAATEPTELHKNFKAWLEEHTGVEVDLKTVQLACSMRMDFQKSEENQADLKARKQAAAEKAAKAKAEKIAKAKAQIAKLEAEVAAETAAVEPASTPAPAEDKPKATARRARKATATAPESPATPAKRAARTRRTTAAKTSTK